MIRKTVILLVLVTGLFMQGYSQNKSTTAVSYKTITDLNYRSSSEGKQDQTTQSCTLDIYYPTTIKKYPTIIWFHGGSLTSGSKEIPAALKNKGMAIVGVNYRLSPAVKCPAYIDDAAAAVAWVFKHIEDYGGDPSQIYLSGHSAGGYLCLMLGLDREWLSRYQVNANNIAGLLVLSGQAITHFTIRAERGIPDTTPIVDQYAPLYYVRKDGAPILLITGDREQELLGRYEENAYLYRMLKLVGHPNIELHEIQGTNHGTMVTPGLSMIINYLRSQKIL